MARVLVAGFEPFGGRRVNPASEVVTRLAERGGGTKQLAAHPLPVSFARLRPALDELVAAHDPELILGLGLAAGSALLRLEQVAINVMAAGEVPDNDGQAPAGEAIEPAGPAARFSTLDNDGLA